MKLFDLKKDNKLPAGVAECERQIEALEERRRGTIYQIGNIYVEENKLDNVVGTPYETLLRELAQIAQETTELETRKLALQGLRKCEKCGHILDMESAFCNKCGEKLEELNFVECDSQKKKQCEKCGTVYKDGDLFCMSCGNKLG